MGAINSPPLQLCLLLSSLGRLAASAPPLAHAKEGLRALWIVPRIRNVVRGARIDGGPLLGALVRCIGFSMNNGYLGRGRVAYTPSKISSMILRALQTQ